MHSSNPGLGSPVPVVSHPSELLFRGVLGGSLLFWPGAEQRPLAQSPGGAGVSWVILSPAVWQPEPSQLQRTGLPTSSPSRLPLLTHPS